CDGDRLLLRSQRQNRGARARISNARHGAGHIRLGPLHKGFRLRDHSLDRRQLPDCRDGSGPAVPTRAQKRSRSERVAGYVREHMMLAANAEIEAAGELHPAQRLLLAGGVSLALVGLLSGVIFALFFSHVLNAELRSVWASLIEAVA